MKLIALIGATNLTNATDRLRYGTCRISDLGCIFVEEDTTV